MSVNKFNKLVEDAAKGKITARKKIKKPNLVEILISVSVSEKRFKLVDVDNLAKCIIDSLNGIAFEDDSQISRLICNKHVHPMKIDAVMIGITKITETNKGLGDDIKLLQNFPWG